MTVSQRSSRRPEPIGPAAPIFLLCWLCAALDGFDVQTVAYAAPAIMRDWSLVSATYGLIVSAGFVGLMLGAFFQSAVADRLGRRLTIIWCVLAFGLFSLTSAFAQSPVQLGALRFLIGLPLGGLMPNLVALAVERAPPNRRLTMTAFVLTGFPVGGFGGGLVAADVIGRFGWRGIFVLGAIIPLLLVPVLIRGLPKSDGHPRSPINAASGPIMNGTPRPARLPDLLVPAYRWRTLMLAGAFFFAQVSLYLLLTWLPAIAASRSGEGAAAMLPLALFNLGAVAGGLGLGWICDRANAAATLTITYLAGGAVCVTACWLSAPAQLVGLALIIGFLIGGSQLTSNGLAASLYPFELRMKALGALIFLGRIGTISAPLVGGGAIDLAGNHLVVFLLAAAAAMITAGFFAMLISEAPMLTDD